MAREVLLTNKQKNIKDIWFTVDNAIMDFMLLTVMLFTEEITKVSMTDKK